MKRDYLCCVSWLVEKKFVLRNDFNISSELLYGALMQVHSLLFIAI